MYIFNNKHTVQFAEVIDNKKRKYYKNITDNVFFLFIILFLYKFIRHKQANIFLLSIHQVLMKIKIFVILFSIYVHES